MDIKQLFIGAILHYDCKDEHEEKYYSICDVAFSTESLEDVIKKCIDHLWAFEMDYEIVKYAIHITHHIFEYDGDSNDVSYENFAYKYGPAHHYFDNENLENSCVVFEKSDDGKEYLYPQDFVMEEASRIKIKDICGV